MKIMIVSDAVWHSTGYGIQTRLLAQRMLKDGHEVLNYAPGAFNWGGTTVDGVRVLSSEPGDDRWGNRSYPFHLNRHQPDLVITWLDCQGLAGYGMDTTPTWMWAPIDTWPVPANEQNILSRAEKVLVPSQWGIQQLSDVEIESEYVPCGFDSNVFYPDAEGGKEFRKTYGVEDDEFLIGMVGLNGGSPDRKGYGFAFDVIRKFVDEHPKTKVYIHCGKPEGEHGAIDLYEQRRQLGLESVVFFPPQMGPEGFPEKYMRHAYSAMDVLLHTSLTEGFGVPVVEAQACGTPVVANAATSVTELVLRPGSIPCPPVMDMVVSTNTRIALPDVNALAKQLFRVMKEPRRMDPAAVERFDFDHVYETYWRPLLSSVPARLEIERGRKLMIGAGSDQKEGFTHHDRELFWDHIDVAHDLEVFPYPWADDSWDYIEMSDVLEHLRGNVTQVLDELWRITAPGGHVFIHTVEAGSWQHSLDPTHVQGFNLHSFDYYDPETNYGRQYKYSEKTWKIVKRTIEPSGGVLVIMTPRKLSEVFAGAAG